MFKLITTPALLAATALMVLSGCADRSIIITDCQAVGNKTPHCGWQRPEDMELLPDGKTLIVSQMEIGHGTVPGAIALLDTATGAKQELLIEQSSDELWGDQQCTQSVGNHLGPHGIHLSTREDGRQQLLVVNHGQRESIEFYQVNSDSEQYQLQWRGCAEAPEGSFLNDVVALPGGGFAVTHMFTKGDAPVGTMNMAELKALFGFNPGHLLQWDAKNGYQKLGDFSGDYPNGLQISADGDYLYINLWAESKIKKFELASGKVVGEAEVMHPDNSQWDGDGRLLVTGHDFTINDLRVCTDLDEGTCPGAFEVMSVDTESMTSQSLMRIEGAPMGAGTVTQRVGDSWFIGSFLGDRVLQVPVPK